MISRPGGRGFHGRRRTVSRQAATWDNELVGWFLARWHPRRSQTVAVSGRQLGGIFILALMPLHPHHLFRDLSIPAGRPGRFRPRRTFSGHRRGRAAAERVTGTPTQSAGMGGTGSRNRPRLPGSADFQTGVRRRTEEAHSDQSLQRPAGVTDQRSSTTGCGGGGVWLERLHPEGDFAAVAGVQPRADPDRVVRSCLPQPNDVYVLATFRIS